MKSGILALVLLAAANPTFAQSLTGSIDPNDPNDVLLVTFTLAAPSSLNVQSFGYGGSGNAPGGRNAAGVVIAPGGFDPYASLFSGVGPAATFVASNDDGLCPPGAPAGAFCPDPTLHINTLPAGSYVLALSVFDNFSFAENLGAGTLGDLFIGLGNYYDPISNTIRTANYAIDLTATGLTIGSVSTLNVVSPPVISKVFTPKKILPGGTATVSFSLSNPNPLSQLTGVAFTDSLPAGLVVASPNSLTSTCGGTATATPGSGTITLVGATLTYSGTCTITALVTAPEGIYPNSVTVTSVNGGAGNTATDTLFAATPASLSKTFGAVSIGVNNTTSLTFTLANPNHIVTLHGIQFSDTLPTGLVVATPNGLTGSCGGGTITAVAAGNLITLGSATLAPQTNCTFTVNVTANGAALATLTNTTGTVTSNEALPGAAASVNIFVGDPFQVSYAANLSIGDSFANITNTGALGAALPSGTTASTTGAICANVYAFTPDEQLVSCCSCPVTPGGLVSLSAKNDLASNTLTPAVPTALVIKLVASIPVGGSCNNSAASVTAASLANGMKSFETTIHATPTTGPYGVTETPFSPATMSAGELSRITNLCNFILANGSGFGVCRSCRLGGLGTDRQ